METDQELEQLPPRRGLHLLLPDHHRRIEALCREMLAWAYTDDTRELASRWNDLESELRDHMAAEEEVILPAYAVAAPAEAKQILDDHARLRELLTPLGVEVELHETRAARLRAIVDALAAHALHEDATMYPWAEHNLSQVAHRLLFVRIGRWFSRT